MLLILGSLSLLLGLHTRHGAMLLFGVTIVATVLMHAFWQIHDNAAARQADFDLFSRNVAIAGGLLLLVGMGPGRLRSTIVRTGRRRNNTFLPAESKLSAGLPVSRCNLRLSGKPPSG